MMSQYAAQVTGRGPWERTAPVWDGVCQPVAAARRLTLEPRSEGQSDLDLLIRNLEHVAVPAPAPDAWHGWAAGYHATEAAASLNAGLETVAAWHRSQLALFDVFLRNVELAPAKGESRGRYAPPLFNGWAMRLSQGE